MPYVPFPRFIILNRNDARETPPTHPPPPLPPPRRRQPALRLHGWLEIASSRMHMHNARPSLKGASIWCATRISRRAKMCDKRSERRNRSTRGSDSNRLGRGRRRYARGLATHILAGSRWACLFFYRPISRPLSLRKQGLPSSPSCRSPQEKNFSRVTTRSDALHTELYVLH